MSEKSHRPAQLTHTALTPVLVVSHPRSGNNLVLDLMRRHFPQTSRPKLPLQKPETLILDIGAIWKNKMSEKKALQRLQSTERPLIKMHGFDVAKLEAEHADFLQFIRDCATLFYIVRDIRPMLCSYHEYAKLFRPEAQVPIGEFIRQNEPEAPEPSISRVKYWAEEVLYWIHQPGVTLMKYEEILENPVRQIERIAQALKLPATIRHPLLPSKSANRWQDYLNRYLTILPESTSAPMKTETPNWFEVFSDSDLQFIREEGAEALDQLGYTI